MRVCISIDTEFSIGGAFADAARQPLGAPMVLCAVDGRSQGLGFLLDCFQRHRITATFFVETAQRFYFGAHDPMGALARSAAAAGHEVQLHVHPCWSVFRHQDWRARVHAHPRQDDFTGRPAASTLQLLRHGQQAFAEWGLAPPTVFRSGNLQYDDQLYRALAAAGIPYSSSIGLGVYDAGLPAYRLYAGRHVRHGVVECPVLSYRGWGAQLKSMTIVGSSFTEMRKLLERAHAAGLELVVLLTHPFEYVLGDPAGRLRRHALNQARMERLCAYLAEHADRFQTCGMAAAASQPLTPASSHNPLLRGAAWHAACRVVTQTLYQHCSLWAQRLTQRYRAQRARWPATHDWLPAGIAARHGTWRGAVRAALALAALRSGALETLQLQHPQRVRRVVFVCLGNICRSAYALRVAEGLGMHAVSIGLSTVTGAASPDAALSAALRGGENLQAHRATSFSDFEPQPGDLFIAMEIRHAHELRRRLIAQRDVQITLLGLWCTPPSPHLHDPYTLSDAYFDHCFTRVRQAVHKLHHALHRSAP